MRTKRLETENLEEEKKKRKKEEKNLWQSNSTRMLCLDIKLVSRLRGVSSTSGSSTNVPPVPLSSTSTSSTTASGEKCKRSRGRRESSAGNGNSVTESDSDEETLPAAQMIHRNRSRSVCVSALSAVHSRHLHRRASHHVYVS